MWWRLCNGLAMRCTAAPLIAPGMAPASALPVHQVKPVHTPRPASVSHAIPPTQFLAPLPTVPSPDPPPPPPYADLCLLELRVPMARTLPLRPWASLIVAAVSPGPEALVSVWLWLRGEGLCPVPPGVRATAHGLARALGGSPGPGGRMPLGTEVLQWTYRPLAVSDLEAMAAAVGTTQA